MPQIPLSLREAEGLSVWPTNAETGTVQRQHPRLPRRCPVVTWGHASTGVGKNTSPFANNALSRRTSTEKRERASPLASHPAGPREASGGGRTAGPAGWAGAALAPAAEPRSSRAPRQTPEPVRRLRPRGPDRPGAHGASPETRTAAAVSKAPGRVSRHPIRNFTRKVKKKGEQRRPQEEANGTRNIGEKRRRKPRSPWAPFRPRDVDTDLAGPSPGLERGPQPRGRSSAERHVRAVSYPLAKSRRDAAEKSLARPNKSDRDLSRAFGLAF